MFDLFVSYKSRNRNWVKQLVFAFQEHGWSVRWDQDIPNGADYPAHIDQWVESARGVVLVWSADWIANDLWLSRETERHWASRTLFIVRSDGSALNNRIAHVQASDFTGWNGQAKSPDFQKLLKSVSQKLRVPTGSEHMTERSGSYTPEKPVFGAGTECEFPTANASSAPSAKAVELELRTSDSKDGRPAENPDADPRARRSPTGRGADYADPTTEFPKGEALYRYTDADRDRWSARLLSERLIAVRSPDDEITSSAIDALLGAREIRDYYDHRLLKFDADNRKRTDLSLSELMRGGIGDPDRATLVVVDPYKSLSFIDSTLGGSFSARSTAMELWQHDLLFVIQIGSRYRADFDHRRSSFNFGCWDIQWLSALLALHFPEAELAGMIDRLGTRREKGDWGKPRDDYEFHAVLQTVLADGPQNLIDTLDRQERAAQGADRVVVSQPALKAFRTDSTPYLKRMLLCAAYFPGLSADEFRKICLTIAGSDTVFVPEGTIGSRGDLVLSPQKVTLEQAWRDWGYRIIADSGLRDIEREPGIFTIAFQQPEEKDAIVGEIERISDFFSQSAIKLWEAGLVFDPSATEELVEGMTRLFAAALGRCASWQRPEWLSLTLVQHLGDGRADDLEELLGKALDTFVLERTSRLLRSVLADRRYSRYVDLWLNFLLARNGHGHALKLAEHLRYAAGFQYLHWLKRLANEGPSPLQPAVYRALLLYARQSSGQVWEILESVREWLPDSGRTADSPFRAQRHALRLIIDYSLDAARNLSFDDMAMWPSRYPLFRDFALELGEQDPKEANDARLRMLIEWLLHPALDTLFTRESAHGAWDVRGRITLLWAYVLRGLDRDATPAPALEYYSKLVGLCAESTQLDGRKGLLRAWSNERSTLSQRLPGLNESEVKARRLAVQFIDALEEDFRRAIESHGF